MLLRLAIALLLVPIVATSSSAQLPVSGVALESTTGRVLPCLRVELVDSVGRTLARTRTGASGEFTFEPPAEVPHQLRFSAFGLKDLLLPFIDVEASPSGGHSYRLVLSATDAALDPEQFRLTAELPEPIRNGVFPKYPPELRRRNVKGDVVIGIVVTVDGRIDTTSVFPFAATHPEFYDAVLDALPGMRFRPLHSSGAPVCTFFLVPFSFRLQGD